MLNGEKIIKLGIADEVLSLSEKGWSALKIMHYLKKKGFNVSDQTIRNFLRWRKKINDNEMGKVIKVLTQEALSNEKVSSFEELINALRLTNKLIEMVETNQVFSEKEKVIFLERLIRTKTLVSTALQRYVEKLDIAEILYRVFVALLESLKSFFAEKQVDSDIANSIISIIRDLYTNFELKITENVENKQL